MSVDPGELLIPLKYVAKALGWSTELTRDRFLRAKIAIRPPGAREFSVMRSTLLAEMPMIVARIDEMSFAGELQILRRNRQ